MTDPRTPPSDLDAERALIGSILIDPAELTRVSPCPMPDDFYTMKHASIWRAILKCSQEGSPPDALIVWDAIKKMGFDNIVTSQDVADLAAFVSSPVHAPEYAKIVCEKSKARGLLQIAHSLAESVYNSAPVDEAHNKAQESLYALGAAVSRASAVPISDVVYKIIETIETGERVDKAVPTGYVALDDLLAGGWHPGELSLIAGRASMGKTSFALNCVANAAMRGHGVLIFSLEMTAESVTRNMLAAQSEVSGERMRKGRAFIGDEGIDRIVSATSKMSSSKIWISDACTTDVADIRREVQRIHSREGIELVVIDYLQLLEGRGGKSREQEVSAISRGLKILSKDTGLSIVALAQLNRMAEHREGNRPRMADLRESGALEQDADNVLLVYRPYYYTKAEADKNTAEIIVAKQRHGATETVRLCFDPEITRFRDPTRSDLS